MDTTAIQTGQSRALLYMYALPDREGGKLCVLVLPQATIASSSLHPLLCQTLLSYMCAQKHSQSPFLSPPPFPCPLGVSGWFLPLEEWGVAMTLCMWGRRRKKSQQVAAFSVPRVVPLFFGVGWERSGVGEHPKCACVCRKELERCVKMWVPREAFARHCNSHASSCMPAHIFMCARY